MISRRSFIIASGLTALASTRVFGANDKLRVGIIGAGHRMKGLLDAADKTSGLYDIVAVSDVYGPARDAIVQRSNGLATAHLDYREVLQKDIDAVIIASPDHWHVQMAVDALKAGKDVYLEKPVTHTIEEGAVLTRAMRATKQDSAVRYAAAQLVTLSRCGGDDPGRKPGPRGAGADLLVAELSPELRPPKPIDQQALDWKMWLGSAPDQPFSEEKFAHWRWFWNFGGGAMTDLFTHWIDVVHWAMKSDQPRQACMIADKYIFEAWDCPDTIQAAFRYPNFDVVYEGMMNSSIDDGGLEFRGTEATLKIDRGGFAVYRERIEEGKNPVITGRSSADGTISHMENFFDCVKSRKEPNAPVETGVAAARAGHIGNLAHQRGGQISWPLKA